MWELLPITIRKSGRLIVDMFHIKQPARYTGWVRIDGEEISLDGFVGGRDRTFGIRASEEVDFWLWFEAVFEDRAIEAWVWESSDGTVQYVDGGFTFDDGRLSKRFVAFQHNVIFEGDRKRPLRADIVFVDEDGETFRVTADAKCSHVNANYGAGLSLRRARNGLSYYSWNSNDPADLAEVESNAVSIDQLMEFEMNGMVGHGIFEILARGDHYQRYPNWGPSPRRAQVH